MPRIAGIGDQKAVGAERMRAFQIFKQLRRKVAVYGVEMAEIDRRACIGERRAVILEQKLPIPFRESTDIHEDERTVAQTAAAVDVLREAVLAGAVIALDEYRRVERGVLLAYGAQPLRGGVAAEIVFERRIPPRRRREAARGRWTSRFLSGG